MLRNNGWTVRKGPFQLLALDSGSRQLFNVAADPGGTIDLLGSGAADAATVAAELETLAAGLRDSR